MENIKDTYIECGGEKLYLNDEIISIKHNGGKQTFLLKMFLHTYFNTEKPNKDEMWTNVEFD